LIPLENLDSRQSSLAWPYLQSCASGPSSVAYNRSQERSYLAFSLLFWLDNACRAANQFGALSQQYQNLME
jgi:hypothetical protein